MRILQNLLSKLLQTHDRLTSIFLYFVKLCTQKQGGDCPWIFDWLENSNIYPNYRSDIDSWPSSFMSLFCCLIFQNWNWTWRLKCKRPTCKSSENIQRRQKKHSLRNIYTGAGNNCNASLFKTIMRGRRRPMWRLDRKMMVASFDNS